MPVQGIVPPATTRQATYTFSEEEVDQAIDLLNAWEKDGDPLPGDEDFDSPGKARSAMQALLRDISLRPDVDATQYGSRVWEYESGKFAYVLKHGRRPYHARKDAANGDDAGKDDAPAKGKGK